LLDISRGTATRFDLNPSEAESAVWAPDGRRIIFGSIRTGQMNDLYQMNLNDAANAAAVIKSNESKAPLSWSSDGRFLLYGSVGGGTKNDLWVLPLEAGRKPVPFLRTEFDESNGRFSPDGRYVAYVSDESGRYEVYVRSFSPGPPPSPGEGKWLISNNGGHHPMWRRDGRELYYIDLGGKLMALNLAAGSVFEAGVPRTLFQALPRGDFAAWAPSPDGKRFLFLVPEAQEGTSLTVVLNWQAGLKK
jgi:eukaryotic-like serine/threonine-protein kinase